LTESLADWLALREPADFAARSQPLTLAVADAIGHGDPLHAVDLGTGTGSNVRYLAGHLPPEQHWLLVDQDPAVLAHIPDRMSIWAAAGGFETALDAEGIVLRRSPLEWRLQPRRVDLGKLDDVSLFAGRGLVTASALLDLVSEQWLRELAHQCQAAGAAALFALTYTGRSRCSPADPEDELVRELMNQHQKTDKRLGGPAAGPGAVDVAARSFRDVGYVVRREPADWVLPPGAKELQRQLMGGWADAAVEVAPDRADTIRKWLARRLTHLDANRSAIVVCHEDLAAWPAARSRV
jgi:hypothetical protein